MFSKMDTVTKERLKKKCAVCYLLAKENIAFRKYPATLELEEHHGVELGLLTEAKILQQFSLTTQQKFNDNASSFRNFHLSSF